MFKIDPTSNRINPLEIKRFRDLGFTERKHLQECLENYPQALAQGYGDELLIIYNLDANISAGYLVSSRQRTGGNAPL